MVRSQGGVPQISQSGQSDTEEQADAQQACAAVLGCVLATAWFTPDRVRRGVSHPCKRSVRLLPIERIRQSRLSVGTAVHGAIDGWRMDGDRSGEGKQKWQR